MAMCPDNVAAIGFSSDGMCLEISDVKLLGEAILQKYFKHRNVSSFIRQLNNYGFKTIPVLMSSSVAHSFAHENFQRGRPDLLEGVKRRGNVMDEAQKLTEQLFSLRQRDAELSQRNTHLSRMNEQLAKHNHELAEENKRLRMNWTAPPDHLARYAASHQQSHPQEYAHQTTMYRGADGWVPTRMIHSGGGPNAEAVPQPLQQQQPPGSMLSHHDYPVLSESVPFQTFPLFPDEM
jgi:hypothetical protein